MHYKMSNQISKLTTRSYLGPVHCPIFVWRPAGLLVGDPILLGCVGVYVH
jgi:hypothetical protein